MGFKEFGPWMLSLAALAQFWIYLLWVNRRGRGKLEAFDTGRVELGFDANGPLIGLAGVLRAHAGEVFVRSLEVTLTADKDGIPRRFRWMASKPEFLPSLEAAGSWEMPHPFPVSAGATRRFNAVFQDPEAAADMQVLLLAYRQEWREAEAKVQERRTKRMPGEGDPDAAMKEAVSEFKRKEICAESYTLMDRRCYWEPGSYTLTLAVRAEGPVAGLSRSVAAGGNFRFNLGKHEAKRLKANCIAILDEPICAALGRASAPIQAVLAEFEGAPARAGLSPK